MPTRLITLNDGIRIEAEVTDSRVAAPDGRVEQTIDSIKPMLVRVVHPVAVAWNELNQHTTIQQAEIELGFGFEASGTLFIASSKGNINLKVKLVLKPKRAANESPIGLDTIAHVEVMPSRDPRAQEKTRSVSSGLQLQKSVYKLSVDVDSTESA